MQLIPKITYHTDQEIERALNGHGPSHRQQREPFTAVTLSALLELRIAGAGTGTSALTLQSSSFYSLRMAIDADFQSLERSISHLQESLTSLVEVVLQNRRGLDLSFLPRGRGGVSLRSPKGRMLFLCRPFRHCKRVPCQSQRKSGKGYRARQGWSRSWFNSYPRMTALISTLLSKPLLILIMLLTFGPCILNKLVTFIKE